ncbi:LysR substrate-binding domain-containing protein [Microvirga zambiensis]|uniref:LysR substrate-binding domain-containing protein n=1 Tax=Microvirga zambiensis TaxID=1402137 RepID=UPI001FEC8ACF|nr:LysR substrate-binding domain-containing protein [Microvirga zambiensis]
MAASDLLVPSGVHRDHQRSLDCAHGPRRGESNPPPAALLRLEAALDSYHAIVACVAAGTGVAIVPAEVPDQAVLGTAVERHPLPERFRINRTHLVWQGEASPPLRALMDLLPGAHKAGIMP